jgi:nucleoid DNA-binding protein
MDAKKNSDLAKAIDQNTKSNQKLAETIDLFIQVITPELNKTDTVRKVQEERDALLKDARRLFGE